MVMVPGEVIMLTMHTIAEEAANCAFERRWMLVSASTYMGHGLCYFCCYYAGVKFSELVPLGGIRVDF